MTAMRPQRRTTSLTANEIAQKLGVSRRTVQRMVAEPRAEFEQRAKDRRAAVIELRLQGCVYREIAAQLGLSVGTVGHVLYTARRNGEWAEAVARHAARPGGGE